MSGWMANTCYASKEVARRIGIAGANATTPGDITVQESWSPEGAIRISCHFTPLA